MLHKHVADLLRRQGASARLCASVPAPALLGVVPAFDSTAAQVLVGLAIGAAIIILAVRLAQLQWKGASATFEPLQLQKPKRKPRSPSKPKAQEAEPPKGQ